MTHIQRKIISMSNAKIASIVRNKRTSLGLSQEEMAKAMKVSINYISLIENEKKEPGNTFLRNFSKKFSFPIVLLTKQQLIPKPKNEREKQLFVRFERLVSDLEDLFIKNE